MKYKNTYLLAGIPVEMICTGEYLVRQCRDYITDMTPEFSIEMTEDDIAAEKERSEDKSYSDGYYESLAFYRKLCDKIPDRGIILFHSCAVAVDGKAYFSPRRPAREKVRTLPLERDSRRARAHHKRRQTAYQGNTRAHNGIRHSMERQGALGRKFACGYSRHMLPLARHGK